MRIALPWPVLAVVAFVMGAILGTLWLRTGFHPTSPIPGAGAKALAREQAASFRDFPVYWLGEEFEGLPLTAVLRAWQPRDPRLQMGGGGPRGQNAFIFVYGTCRPKGGEQPSCPPPLALRVEPYCDMRPELFDPVLPRGEPLQVRGAQVQKIGSHLRVWTGSVGITIFTTLPDEVALRVVRGLRSLNGMGATSPAQPLGPPVATCQD
jgi:hypothetical protein